MQRIPIRINQLEAFVTLAKTLNLSVASQILKTTHHIVKNHIEELENHFGKKLFELIDRQYHLTSNGKIMLEAAEELLRNFRAFSESPDGKGLRRSFQGAHGIVFDVQKHNLLDIPELAPPHFGEALEARDKSRFNPYDDPDDDKLSSIREHLVMYRQTQGGFFCMAVGKQSSEAIWKGKTWQQSALGTTIGDSDIFPDTAINYLKESFESVLRTGNCWYDHISTFAMHSQRDEPQALNYQRLVMPFKDDVVATISHLTNDLEIDGLETTGNRTMPPELTGQG